MKKKLVTRKAGAEAVFKPKRRVRLNRRKAPIHTLAAVFKRYDESLSQADLLFEVFSPERLEAQRVALNRLRERLLELGFDNVDWDDAYKNVVQYATIKPAQKAA